MSEAKDKYLEYLDKYTAKHRISLTEAHRHLIPKVVAQVYGVTESEMMEMSNSLSSIKGGSQ